MHSPKVSICIPVYNSAGYLGAAIESALGQQYDRFEILIVDDGSTDGSDEIAADFARRSSVIRFVRNSQNIGMVANWNRCLELARGEYIKFLFGDDLLTAPDAIERLAAVLDRHQEVALAGSFRTIVDSGGRVLAEQGFTPTGRVVAGRQAIRDCLTAARNYIGEPTVVMFRRQQALRGFDPAYRQMVDLEMWFHLLMQGALWVERQPLAAFRQHQRQQTTKNNSELVHFEEFMCLYDRYLRASGIWLPRLLNIALYYVQCYQIWKGYRYQGVFERDYAEKIIARYISIKRFKSLIPVYKVLNPLWKLVLWARRYNPLTR